MTLADLWNSNRQEFENKQVSQLVALAGDGRLTDGSVTSNELREFFDQVPSRILQVYIDQCLSEGFNNSGLVLQDLINQVGKRLGFAVRYGRYKGVKNEPGFDGVWKFPVDDYHLVVEVKTTDTYRINLETLVTYRRTLANENEGFDSDEASSILIVVGREDTGDLESQIRGSKHSWSIRLISVDALVRLMQLKEEVDNPETVYRIHQTLVPREFTKLDEIIDLAFAATTEVKQEETAVGEDLDVDDEAPASFHDACIRRVEARLRTNLVRRSKSSYSSTMGNVAVTCHVSKFYNRQGYQFWFAFHPHQFDFLSSKPQSYVAFGCGTDSKILLIPFRDFQKLLDPESLNITERGEGFYYHIQIANPDNQFFLIRKRGFEGIELTSYHID